MLPMGMKQRDSTPAIIKDVMIPDMAFMLPASMLPMTEKRAITQAIPRTTLSARRAFRTEGVASIFEMYADISRRRVVAIYARRISSDVL